MKKLVALLMCAILVASMLAGCGKAQEPADTSTTQPGTTEESASTEETKAKEYPKTEMTLMMVSGASNDATNKMLAKIIPEFNENNEFNTTIEHVTYETEQYKSKIATLMASNAQPDIFYTWEAGFLKPFVEAGKVYPIGDALEKDPEWKGRFLEGVFGPLTFDDGKIYGVPNFLQCGVVYYNTRLFEENGLKEPETWDEFLHICETLKSKGIIPISMPSQKSWIASQFLQEMANGIGGADLFNKLVSGETTWDDERFIQAGKEFQSLVNKGYFQEGFLGMTQDEGRDLFKNEKAAMYFMGSWDTVNLTDPAAPVSKNLGVFKLTPINPENKGTILGSVGTCFSISSTAKCIDGAIALVKRMSDPDVQAGFAYEYKYNLATNVKLDESKLNPVQLEIQYILNDVTTLTPWYDRVFGAGEGTEFNNAAIAIASNKDVEEQMKALAEYAKANRER
ncbi:MAG: ABC transporter substrate-binding protein [Bacillota bacterium]